jgi:hypothetical protein
VHLNILVGGSLVDSFSPGFLDSLELCGGSWTCVGTGLKSSPSLACSLLPVLSLLPTKEDCGVISYIRVVLVFFPLVESNLSRSFSPNKSPLL